MNIFLRCQVHFLVVDTLEKGEEDVVTFKVECREVDEDLTSPNANRKGVFSSSWPYSRGIESFKKMIVDRFSLSKITAMHYCDGFDVICALTQMTTCAYALDILRAVFRPIETG